MRTDRPRFRPTLSALEDRVTPASYFWDGGGGPSSTGWNNPLNWTGDVAPSSGETDLRVWFTDFVGTSTINVSSLSIDVIGFLDTAASPATDVNLNVFFSFTLDGTYNQTGYNVLDQNGRSEFSGTGTTTLSSSVVFQQSGTSFTTVIANSISGSGDLVKTGAGDLRLASNFGSHSGDTRINDGTLSLYGSTSDAAVSSSVYIGDGTGNLNTARLYVNSSYEIPDNASVFVQGDGILELAPSVNEDFGQLNMSGGNVYLSSGANLTLRTNNTSIYAGNSSPQSRVYGPATPGTLSSLNGTLVIDVNNGSSAVDLQVDVPLTGTPNLRKVGPGVAALSKTYNLTGTTEVGMLGSLVIRTASPAVDVTLTATDSTHLAVIGSPSNDTLSFSPGTGSNNLRLNETNLKIVGGTAANVALYGQGGTDTGTLNTGGSSAVSANISPGSAYEVGSGFAGSVTAENITLYGRPQDAAYLFDSPGNDLYVTYPTYGLLQGAGFFEGVVGFGTATARATAGGSDAAYLYGSAGNDIFVSGADYALLQGAGFYYAGVGFDGVTAFGSGGTDAAYLNDGAGDDYFNGSGNQASLAGPGYFVGIEGFAGVNVYGNNGGTNRKTVGQVNYYLGFNGPWV